MSYLSYSFASQVKFLRNRASFKKIRFTLALLPAMIFPYHGIKFMTFYKRKAGR